jgi:Holliday junction resolvase RusA-like endonuclease
MKRVATHLLEFAGHVPSKKNAKHAWRGRVVMDPKIRAAVTALSWQAREQWQAKRPIEFCSTIRFHFRVANRRGDLDGKVTTILDVLVEAGVLKDDNSMRVPSFTAQAIHSKDEGVSISIDEKPQGEK